jgi:hypothetical protein
MLTGGSADEVEVIHRALVLIALICSGLVLASFVMFAHDQISGAAKTQATEVNGPVQSQQTRTKHQVGEPGRFITGAASKLTAPFRSIIQSTSAWVQQGVPTIIALLVYGVGLGFLARFSRGFA